MSNIFWTLRNILRIEHCSSPSYFNLITPNDSKAWNHRELATLLALSESSAKDGFKPLIIGWMSKNATTELHLGVDECILAQTGQLYGNIISHSEHKIKKILIC